MRKGEKGASAAALLVVDVEFIFSLRQALAPHPTPKLPWAPLQ